jgi:hypothetical protein
MITVKKLAIVVVLGSLGFWGSIKAIGKDVALLIWQSSDTGSHELQVNEMGKLEVSSGSFNQESIFTVKEKRKLQAPITKESLSGFVECFTLESWNGREIKAVPVNTKEYDLEEISEKNKDVALDAWFYISGPFSSNSPMPLICYPGGKIEKTTNTSGVSFLKKFYVQGILGMGLDDPYRAYLSLFLDSHYFHVDIVDNPIKTQKQESITKKDLVVSPKEANQLEEMTRKLEETTRKLEEQLEINRKLQEEINNLKANKSSDTAIIEEESKPVVSSKQSQSSRVSAPRQGAKGRGQTQRK